jgi:hypothetical protein
VYWLSYTKETLIKISVICEVPFYTRALRARISLWAIFEPQPTICQHPPRFLYSQLSFRLTKVKIGHALDGDMYEDSYDDNGCQRNTQLKVRFKLWRRYSMLLIQKVSILFEVRKGKATRRNKLHLRPKANHTKGQQLFPRTSINTCTYSSKGFGLKSRSLVVARSSLPLTVRGSCSPWTSYK